MGLISRVSSRTYRLEMAENPHNNMQTVPDQQNNNNNQSSVQRNYNQQIPNSQANQISQEFEDIAITNFMNNLQHYEPTIPDEVTRHFVNKGGVDTQDPRILRLFSVVAQKFVADIVVDALKDKQEKMKNAQNNIDPNAKMVLTAEDLNNVLSEYGVGSKKPPYY